MTNARQAKPRLRCDLKFALEPQAKNVEGAAVGVETRTYDVLEITGEPERLSNVYAVKQIQAAFHGGLDGPVPDEPINAALNFGYPLQVARHARDIPGATPRGTFRQQSEGDRTIGGGVRVHFGLSVGIHTAREHADVVRDVLLGEHPGAEFHVRLPDPAKIRRVRVV